MADAESTGEDRQQGKQDGDVSVSWRDRNGDSRRRRSSIRSAAWTLGKKKGSQHEQGRQDRGCSPSLPYQLQKDGVDLFRELRKPGDWLGLP